MRKMTTSTRLRTLDEQDHENGREEPSRPEYDLGYDVRDCREDDHFNDGYREDYDDEEYDHGEFQAWPTDARVGKADADLHGRVSA